jgi:5-methyltetrahydrofolate--homocysteine methyltransferase
MFTTIQNEIEIPLCIDSPNPEAHRAGLRVHKHGRAMVDSITAEKSRIQTIMPIVKKYNSTVVALLHDEQGIPTDVEGRLRVIPKIISAAKEYEVKPQDIFLDCMVYPLSVGTDNGRIYLEALKQVKTMYPDYKTICGLNNISYGLPQTNLLNQAFVTACAALGQEAVFIEIDNITGATLKAINALLGNDSNLTNYLKAFRGNDLNIYNRRDD